MIKLPKEFLKLITGSMTLLSFKFLGTLSSFLLAWVVSHYIGVEELGVYYIAISIATLLFTTATGGFGIFLLKYVPVFKQKGQGGSIILLYKKISRYTFLLLIPASITLYLLAPVLALSIFGNPQLEMGFQIIAMAVPFTGHMLVHIDLLRSMKKFVPSEYLGWLHTPALTLGIFMAFTLFELSVYYLVLSYVLARLAGWLLSGVFLYKPLLSFRGDAHAGNIKGFWNMNVPLAIAAFSTFVYGNTDVLMLGIYLSEADVAVYKVAFSFSAIVLFITAAINTYLAPTVSELYADQNRKGLSRLFLQAGVLKFSLAIPFVILLILFSQQILSLFGDEFRAGSTVVAILSVGMLASMFDGPAGHLLNISGHHKRVTFYTVLFTLQNILLNYWLIPRYQIEGAAIATVLSIIGWRVCAIWLTWTRLKINPTIFRF